MSTEAAIAKGKGILANPEFFLTFFLAGSMGIASVLTVGVSGVWGWGLVGVAALLAAAGRGPPQAARRPRPSAPGRRPRFHRPLFQPRHTLGRWWARGAPV